MPLLHSGAHKKHEDLSSDVPSSAEQMQNLRDGKLSMVMVVVGPPLMKGVWKWRKGQGMYSPSGSALVSSSLIRLLNVVSGRARSVKHKLKLHFARKRLCL